MIHVENSILIEKEVEKVFNVAVDFERHPEFISAYKSVRVLERQGDELLVERVGMVSGREMRWRSKVRIKENESIKAVQLEGPLAGMRVEWSFREFPEGTRLIIINDFEYNKIPLIGNLIGRFIVTRFVNRMANGTLRAIKKKVESMKE